MNHSQHTGHSTSNHSHHDHHRMMIRDFRRRFWISLALTLPVLALSPLIKKGLGLEFSIPGDRYILFGLSSILFFYGGFPFLKGLVDEIHKNSAGMMTLIAVAIQMFIGAGASVLVSVLHFQSSLPMTGVMALCTITAFTDFSFGNRKILRKVSLATIEV
ncbi:MAG: hypothetical protein KDC57_12820 [Saprospiraceae bacterium]|nr:hypothetical protein [Saprospiraceae bacterium]